MNSQPDTSAPNGFNHVAPLRASYLELDDEGSWTMNVFRQRDCERNGLTPWRVFVDESEIPRIAFTSEGHRLQWMLIEWGGDYPEDELEAHFE